MSQHDPDNYHNHLYGAISEDNKRENNDEDRCNEKSNRVNNKPNMVGSLATEPNNSSEIQPRGNDDEKKPIEKKNAFTELYIKQKGKCSKCRKSTVGMNGPNAPAPDICDKCWRLIRDNKSNSKITKKPASSGTQTKLYQCGLKVKCGSSIKKTKKTKK